MNNLKDIIVSEPTASAYAILEKMVISFGIVSVLSALSEIVSDTYVQNLSKKAGSSVGFPLKIEGVTYNKEEE